MEPTMEGGEAWRSFISTLDQLDWHTIGEPIHMRALEDAVKRVTATPGALEFAAASLVLDEPRFADHLRDTAYPQLFHDEFLLHRGVLDSYRIRLHRFKTFEQNGSRSEPIHDHKWFGMSTILTGSYVERRFRETPDGLEQISERTLSPGDTNVVVPGETIHEVSVPGSVPCLTMFVRGPKSRPHSRVFSEVAGTWSFRMQPTRSQYSRDALLRVAALDPSFPEF